jgi:hypothetical protein
MRFRLGLTALFLSLGALVCAQGTVMPAPKFVGLDNSGNPISGGKLCAYSAGTTTPLATYTDSALSVANTNPVILDSAGRATVYLSATSYKFSLRTPGTDATCATGTIVWTQDNISSVPGNFTTVDVLGTAGETLTAGQGVYLSDGSGGKIAGQWYKSDSTNTYSSTTPTIGMVPTTILTSASGTVRVTGQITGLAGLTTGATYYVSTAGAISVTPATNSRRVGQADSTTSIIITPNPPQLQATSSQNLIQGRVSLVTGALVPASDVFAATTVYWTCGGSTTCQISLYDGTQWNVRTYTELSIAVPAVASQVYDVTIQDNGAAAPTIVLLQWTNDTTRSVALTTLNGNLVETGFLGRRYVGTIRTTTVAGQTEDSAAKRFVWNYHNRVPRIMQRLETTASWTYGTNTIRQANGSAANQLDMVIGVADSVVHASLVTAHSATAASIAAACYIGLDSVVAASASASNAFTWSQSVNNPIGMVATFDGVIQAGRHFLSWLEIGGGGTQTWYGTSSSVNGGLSGIIVN